jgi:hypothetical protein
MRHTIPKESGGKSFNALTRSPVRRMKKISVAEQDQCLARMLKPDYPMDGSFLPSPVFSPAAQGRTIEVE